MFSGLARLQIVVENDRFEIAGVSPTIPNRTVDIVSNAPVLVDL